MMLPPRSANEHCLCPGTLNYYKLRVCVVMFVCMGMCVPGFIFLGALQTDAHVADLPRS